MADTSRTGMSYAHLRRNALPCSNPLYDRAESARSSFELERCPYHAKQLREQAQQGSISGRSSEMVRRDKPAPILKPGPALSMYVDALSFNTRWHAEGLAALKE